MSSPKTIPPLTTTFGATLLGTFVASILYGLTAHQTYRYFRRYPGDRLSLQILVGTLCLVDTLHSAFSMHFCYYYLIIHYFDPDALEYSVWTMRMAILIATAPPLISNCFYVSRLYIIGQKNIIILLTLGLLILARLVLELAISIESFIHPRFVDFRPFSWMARSYCAVSLAADIILACCFCWTLHKRRTGYKRTDAKIDLLMVYTINTGSLTSIVCLLSVMSMVFLSQGFVYLGLHAVLGKLYVNSVLAVLNSRRSFNKPDESIYDLAAFDSGDVNKPSKIIFHHTDLSRSDIGAATSHISPATSPVDIHVIHIPELQRVSETQA